MWQEVIKAKGEIKVANQLAFFLKKRFYLFIFRQREREEERGNINVWLPLMQPLLGTWSTTQACALTGNQTDDPLVFRPALNPLSHSSQGLFLLLFKILLKVRPAD